VSRFTAGILGATFLLGVLLYVILGLFIELVEQEPELPPQAELLPPPPGGTRIANHEELVKALAERRIATDVPLQGWRDWLAQRGFLGAQELLAIDRESARERFYDHLEDAALEALAAQGDAGALQRLADRERMADPALALDYYQRAVDIGSTAAMLELATLYATVARMTEADWPGAPPDESALAALAGEVPVRDLNEEALAWLLAAIRDGGEPLATHARLELASNIAEELNPARINAVCSRSVSLFLQASAARRASGMIPVRTDPPPVFLTIADLAEQDPCRFSNTPLEPVLELGSCAAERVYDGRARPLTLWICPGAII